MPILYIDMMGLCQRKWYASSESVIVLVPSSNQSHFKETNKWITFQQTGVVLCVQIVSMHPYLLKSFCLQRNDAIDAYGTYPLAQRPQNGTKDAFSVGVQRTQ